MSVKVRASAQAAMPQIADRQSQYLLDARNFAVGPGALAALNVTVPTDVTVKYTVTVKAADGTDTPSTPPSYTIRATPVSGGQQAQDGEPPLRTRARKRAPATPDGDAARPGFTLPEILIVITVLVVLLGVGMPSFGDFVRNQRLKTASFDLYSTLVHAQRSDYAQRKRHRRAGQLGLDERLDSDRRAELIRTASAVSNVNITASQYRISRQRAAERCKHADVPAHGDRRGLRAAASLST